MKSNVLKLNKETPAARLYDHFKNPPTEARWGGELKVHDIPGSSRRDCHNAQFI